MKKYRIVCLLLSVLFLLQVMVLPITADNDVDISVVNGCNGIDAQVPILGSTQLVENMQAAVLFEVSSGTLMYAWNPDQQIHPAGLVKILTALIAIENGNMQDAVTVKQQVLEQISESTRTSKLQPDEVFTLEQLLFCLLVEGSNDAALVIAHHISGSQEAFVEQMNDYAQELGCTGSLFTNVHGLHDDRQLSTARDMARILSRAIQNEQFSAIFGTTHYDMEKTNKSEPRQLESSNHMMHQSLYEIYYDQRITGGRTGENNMGLRNVASTSQQDKMQLVCVVMGCASKINDRGIVEKIGGFDETSKLLDQAFNGYTTAQLLSDGQSLKQYRVQNGIADVVVGPKDTVSSVVPIDYAGGGLTYQYKDTENAFSAPVDCGRRMGSVEIWYGNVCLAQADLFAMHDVAVNYQQIEDRSRNTLPWWSILLIMLLVLLLAASVYVLITRYRNVMRKRKPAVSVGRRRR